MKSREVTDRNNTRWTCVQAFAGTNGDAAKEAIQRIEDTNGDVEVVCTPSGGAQTVRISLDPQWEESLSDEVLVSAIEKEADQASND